MGKVIVKRCIRPQCMEMYNENTKSRYCDCGALLQITDLEVGLKESRVKKVSLFLLLENDEEIEFLLGKTTLIGRTVDSMAADIDLSQYGGKDVSRKHAMISRENDGYYITNLSQNHSVHVNEKAVPQGKKERLYSEDGIILSRKILLQFVEEE